VGLAINGLDPNNPRHIGVIGLGAGTLATYGRLGDRMRFYEINPLVLRLARSEFSYLADCQAQLEVVLGDARLSLEREPTQNFDVLAVDAFSSDSIPVHLLTVEAFRLYFRHLKQDGVLAVHVSNRYLDLKPIVELAARTLGKQTQVIDTEDDDDIGVFGATWVLVNRRLFEKPELKGSPTLIAQTGLRPWTDDYSNLFRILK
jgi:Spermidine synthase